MRFISPATAVLLIAARAASADSIVLQGAPPLRVTVTGFDGTLVRYVTAGGDAGQREFGRVQRLTVDSEPALSSAESLYAQKQTEAALDDYAKAARTSVTPWVKAFAARRINDIAGPAGRFEPKLAAFLALTQVGVDAARPPLPERGSRLLDIAVTDTEAVLKQPKLADAARTGLLDFLVALHERRGDESAVVAAVERLAKSSPAASDDPVVRARLVGLKIAQAQAALDRRDYAAATKIIDAAAASIADPAQQADALFVRARVAAASARPDDVTAQQDAAVAFVRVVAVANALPGKPNVLASLRAAAGLLERTGDRAAAERVYRQIVRDFADDPAAAAEAKADADRLAAAAKSKP